MVGRAGGGVGIDADVITITMPVMWPLSHEIDILSIFHGVRSRKHGKESDVCVSFDHSKLACGLVVVV